MHLFARLYLSWLLMMIGKCIDCTHAMVGAQGSRTRHFTVICSVISNATASPAVAGGASCVRVACKTVFIYDRKCDSQLPAKDAAQMSFARAGMPNVQVLGASADSRCPRRTYVSSSGSGTQFEIDNLPLNKLVPVCTSAILRPGKPCSWTWTSGGVRIALNDCTDVERQVCA